MRVSRDEYETLTDDERWRYAQGWSDGFTHAATLIVGWVVAIAVTILVVEWIA